MLEKNMEVNDCKYSKGWVAGSKKRHGIKEFVAHGKGGSVVLSDDILDKFATVKVRLVGLEAKDIFKMGETGLFNKIGAKSDIAQRVVAGKKRSKAYITVILTANMDGNIKLKPSVINKPRAFSHKHVSNPNNLGTDWYANPKAWMNGVV
ncbi:hypothetical protein R1flu_009715 [Riccia fluitans]|uniref:DDE-1 domain-containing protein n=1 Tax=Riccia fluitans TaxID=41844 RepID=A0ABD1Z314_9MARC